MQYSHEEKLKIMEYDDKEKDRNFKRENDEKIRKEQLEVDEKDKMISDLKKQVWNLRDENEKLKNGNENEDLEDEYEDIDNDETKFEDNQSEEDVEDEYEDDEEEPIDPEFQDDLGKFITFSLELDGKNIEEEEVNKILKEIEALKSRFRKICKDDGTKVSDFDEWEILSATEKYLKKKKEEFNFWTGRIDFTIEKEWRIFLEEFIREK